MFLFWFFDGNFPFIHNFGEEWMGKMKKKKRKKWFLSKLKWTTWSYCSCYVELFGSKNLHCYAHRSNSWALCDFEGCELVTKQVCSTEIRTLLDTTKAFKMVALGYLLNEQAHLIISEQCTSLLVHFLANRKYRSKKTWKISQNIINRADMYE